MDLLLRYRVKHTTRRTKMSKRWYGSLQNRVMEHNAITEVKIGDAATVTAYSDRYAATVTEIFNKGKSMYVTVQQDHAKITSKDGIYGNQDYEYSRDENGRTFTFRLLPGQPWREVYKNEKGRYVFTEGRGVIFGHREEYTDPSF